MTRIAPFILPFALAACAAGPSPITRLSTPGPLEHSVTAPPEAAPGTCWEKDETPAVIETVTEQVIIQPAEIDSEGAVINPPVFKTETRQAIVTPREQIWFETLCAHEITPDLTASLQRALAARGLYSGPITAELDLETRRAIRKFQADQGLNSSTLSRDAAQKLGLVVIDTPEAPAEN